MKKTHGSGKVTRRGMLKSGAGLALGGVLSRGGRGGIAKK
jgi:hypothetical protein